MTPTAPLEPQMRRALEARVGDLRTLPFGRALAHGSLSVRSYVGYLQAMLAVHGILEEALAQVEDPLVRRRWHEGHRHVPHLETDLRRFPPGWRESGSTATRATLEICDRIRTRSVTRPTSLLGHLYVLEAPELDSILDIRAVRGVLPPPLRDATRYLFHRKSAGGTSSGSGASSGSESRNWAFGAPHPDRAQGMVDAVEELCEGLGQLFDSLHPWPEGGPPTGAMDLNPEAGDHPVPSDPRELQASLVAGRRAWDSFPYLAARFGLRGGRFTDSDAAWLATLSRQSTEAASRQAGWLARVLSHRGIPSIVLEETLATLYEALTEARPERKEEYRKLLAASRRLRDRRCEALDQKQQDRLARRFDGRIRDSSPHDAGDIPGMGRVLVSAVVDEANGTEGAVESVCSWIRDSARFSPVWAGAAEQTILETREAMSSPSPFPPPGDE